MSAAAYDDTMKVLLRGVVAFARWAIPTDPEHAVEHHRADERVRDLLEEVFADNDVQPSLTMRLSQLDVEELLLTRLRGEGESGNAGEMISVNEAQEIVRDSFDDVRNQTDV